MTLDWNYATCHLRLGVPFSRIRTKPLPYPQLCPRLTTKIVYCVVMPIDTEEVSHQETIVDLSPHLKLYAEGNIFL